MKRAFILILYGFFLNAFELSDFFSAKYTGEKKFVLKEIQNGDLKKIEHLVVRIIKQSEGRLIQLERNGKLEMEVIVDDHENPITGFYFIGGRRREINLERLKKGEEGKLTSKKEEVIKIKNKSYSTTRYTYKDDSTSLMANGNQLLKTEIKKTLNIWKDKYGIPVKIEEKKDIVKSTIEIAKKDKILKKERIEQIKLVEIELNND
uniref:Uncharacterized protein n=1 Tax=candidate division WOR-3 bacterium TaxID=2052148 RepID=A0A7C4U7P6_UNCW3